MGIPFEKVRINLTMNKSTLKWIDDSVELLKPFNKTINRSRLVELLVLGFIKAQDESKADVEIEKLIEKEGE